MARSKAAVMESDQKKPEEQIIREGSSRGGETEIGSVGPVGVMEVSRKRRSGWSVARSRC